MCLFCLLQNANSQQNKFRKSEKEQSVTEKKKFNEFYDTINNMYSNYKYNPLGVIICSKIYWLDIGQDTEIQYLDVVKQTNIYVKYSEKLF